MANDPGGGGTYPSRLGLLEWSVLATWALVLCAVYVNTSYSVTDRTELRYYPPFMSNVDRNMNDHLGKEYFQIAQAIRAGRGFADPFGDRTGPTAWMPPALPALLAGLLWASNDNKDVVINIVILLQVVALVGTCLLTFALFRWSAGRTVALGLIAAAFATQIVGHFRQCFQITHDSWLVLLAVDLLVAGLCWAAPLRSSARAAGWGVFGGLVALVSPVTAMVWAVCTTVLAWRLGAWRALLVAGFVSAVVVSPWLVRNYLVLGRLTPVKSNGAFELYQSQCMQPDGVLQSNSFAEHPGHSPSAEGKEYRALGEIAFLDLKNSQFRAAVRAAPEEYLRRTWQRFVAAALVYTPLDRENEQLEAPWTVWICRLMHPLPFLAAVYLLVTARRNPLSLAQWVVLGVYIIYLIPYVAVSYYERYMVPLLGVKAVLLACAVQRLNARWVSPSDRQTDGTGPMAPLRNSGAGVPGWLSHRALAGWAVLGLVVWWNGSTYARFVQPTVQRQATAVILPEFFADWIAARQVANDANPYPKPAAAAREYLRIGLDPGQGVVGTQRPPPPLVVLLLPLGWMDFQDAYTLWNLGSLVALGAVLWVAGRRLGVCVPPWGVPWLGAGVGLSYPLWNQAVNAGTGAAVAALLTAAWVADRDHRPRLSGVLLGLAGGISLANLCLLLTFRVGSRQLSVLIALGVVWLLWMGAGELVGWPVVESYVTDSVVHMVETARTPGNISLGGVWTQLIASNAKTNVELTGMLAIGLSGIIGLTLWARRISATAGPAGAQGDDRRSAGLFSCMIVTVLMLQPVTTGAECLSLGLPLLCLSCSPVGVSRARRVMLGTAAVCMSPLHLATAARLMIGDEGGITGGPPTVLQSAVILCHVLPGVGLMVLFRCLSQVAAGVTAEPPNGQPSNGDLTAERNGTLHPKTTLPVQAGVSPGPDPHDEVNAGLKLVGRPAQ